jgi:hypothetical protein
MPAITEDFPVLFPLCEVRTVHDNWVSFCSNERIKRSIMCRWHLDMYRAKVGRWRGREVVTS